MHPAERDPEKTSHSCGHLDVSWTRAHPTMKPLRQSIIADASRGRNAGIEQACPAGQAPTDRWQNGLDVLNRFNEFDAVTDSAYLGLDEMSNWPIRKAAIQMSKYLQCAHPDCSTDFDYGQGRLFRFHHPPGQNQQPSRSHSVKHFWLCTHCCKTHTIEYRKGLGVLLMQRLDALAGGQRSHYVLRGEEAVATTRLARRHARPVARHRKRKRELGPEAVSSIEVFENRNSERREQRK